MPIESLHTHTTASDGKLSHKEMFELAESLDISVVAYSDHDAVLTDSAMAYLETVRTAKTKWISGIEISAAMPKELAAMDIGKGGLHMLGLFVDPKNPGLMEHCKKAQEARVVRMQKIVAGLKELGFTITEEDCLKASGGETVGRPHIVSALALYPENKTVTERIRKEMEKDAETDPTIKEKFDAMMNMGEYQYPYVLFLSHDAYRKAYVDVSYAPDLDETTAMIRNAGGISFIAHYFTVKKKMPLSLIEKLLQEKRIDGMETVFGLWHLGKNDEMDLEEDKKNIRELLEKYGALATGGPDAHNEEDMRLYASSTKFSEPSEGMTEKMIASGKVSKRFSSL